MKTKISQFLSVLLIVSLAFVPFSGCLGNDDSNSDDEIVDVPVDPLHSAAADFILDQIKSQDNVLYVYRDFSDGLNHYTQKAWTSSNYTNPPAMKEYSKPYSGTSSIYASINLTTHQWGGYLFTNSVLLGNSQPQLSFGEHDAGLNLTGASKLTFYARGENGGERVEFFTGGLGYNEYGTATEQYPDSLKKTTLGYVTLSNEWKQYEISLSGKDLTRVGCGFGWVTDSKNNVGKSELGFYVDEIRFEFDEPRLNPLFLQSYASAKPGTDEAIINNFAYVYDNALAVMVLTEMGEHERAQQIADAMVYALENDRTYSDGRLRNAYMSGNPQSFPGWFSPKGKEFAKMPGFYDVKDKQWYEDYYADSTSVGNMAWAILSLCDVYENAPTLNNGRDKYLKAAEKMAAFILKEKDNVNGGFTGGYEGFDGNQIRATYKSTEHNIDLITVFARLSRIEEMNGDLNKAQKYAEASKHAEKFVLSMYDSDAGCFYTGTAPDGITINKDVLPLDCNTWSLLVLGSDFEDAHKVMNFVEQNMAVANGYDFNEDKDGAWFEGTAQVAVCYFMLGETDQYERVMKLMKANELADGSITAADRDGVSTGFKVSGLDIDWEYGKRCHLGATAWLAFAQMQRNPLEI